MEVDELERKLLVATIFLLKVKEYHENIEKNHIWHLEANAQVGLRRFLNDLDRTIEAVK